MTERIETVLDPVWGDCNNAAIRRASRRLGQLYEHAVGDSDLKVTQYSLLSQIKRAKEPTSKSLALAMVMDLSALGHTLKPLIRDGLVELIPTAEDKRTKRVRLTDKGADQLNKLTGRWQIAQAKFDQAFGAERAAELRRTMAFLASDEFEQAFQSALIK